MAHWMDVVDRTLAGALGAFFAFGAVYCLWALFAVPDFGLGLLVGPIGIVCVFFALNFLYIAFTGKEWKLRIWFGA